MASKHRHAFNPFGAVTGKTSAALFEIRLDNDIIILRGSETEASSQLLKGVVVLCLPQPLKIEDVHLKMTGSLKIGWHEQRVTPTGVSNNKIDRTTEIFSHKWAPFIAAPAGSSSRVLQAGNYEWPFEHVIPGAIAESVEGLPDAHIVYKLKATVARGKLAYDLHAYRPVRIVRTLDPSALELAHAMMVENVWPNKVEYQLEIPQKAIIFGTWIDISMRFTSLLKGLEIGQIKCVLIETQEFTLQGMTAHSERYFKNSRDIDTWTFKLNKEENYHDMLNESGQDGWSLNESMRLPKKLAKCMQDVDVLGMKIRHKVKFNIALHNPDGHVSELRATLPVTIFISPNMPLNADGCLVDQTPLSTQSTDRGAHAPPLYGEHVLDQLYADMEQSGLMTPAPHSGAASPFFAQSRSGSHENLASLNTAIESNGAVPPADLNERLQQLNLNSRSSSLLRLQRGGHSGGNTPHERIGEGEGEYFDGHAGGHSYSNSSPLSRRVSEEDHPTSNITSGTQTPEHHELTPPMADLSKVPSYATAVRAPVRGMSYSNALPDYDIAVSTPNSPRNRFTFGSTTPGIATSSTESAPGSFSAPSFLRSTHFAHSSHSNGVHMPAGDNDASRRLLMMRNRERAQ